MTPRETQERTPQVFEVPPRTPPARCKGCDATIYWIETAAGTAMPVCCDVEGGVRPQRIAAPLGGTEYTAGRGISHFANCPAAGTYRRAR